MTALAGLWNFDGRPDAAEGVARMLLAQEFYGPDTGARWSEGNLALGRRLMRVLPEDSFDYQPLIGGGGRYVLVADIRLDNRQELANSLQIPDLEARGLCDAAILLAAIERWDDSCFEHLFGDYAFALWDGVQRQLLLARDPLGQRPLHFHRGGEFFAFASMPRGLHALAEVPYALNEEKVADFLVLMPENDTKSFFHGIERVAPGHVVTVNPSGITARNHWRPRRHGIKLKKPEEYSDMLRHLLDQAVQCRLRGAQDVGAYLSGGFDSGGVAATAARLLAPSGRRVVAFTAAPREGYGGQPPRNRFVDEGPYAAATAALYPNMEHVLIRTNAHSPLEDLDRNFFLLQRPVLNICNIGWSNGICDAMRERRLTVALGGDCGNLGLSYDGMELLPELIRSGRWLHWWREARALVAQGRMRWRGVLGTTFGPWCPVPLWTWLNRIANGNASEISDYSAVNPQLLAELNLSGGNTLPSKDGFAMRYWALQGGDRGNYNKGILGGWRIDYRDPTADLRLLEFCLAVPTEEYLRDGVPRSLARRALADRLPKFVLDETRKGLQAADWHECMTAVRDGIADELARLEVCPAATKALDLPRLRRLLENWPTGGWERDEVSTPYRLALLRAISTGHFMRRVTGLNL